MQFTGPSTERIVLARVLRLNATIQGLVAGVVVGLGLFIATNWLILKGGAVVGPHLDLLGQFFIGYHVTFLGSFIGLAYGFLFGFLIGSLASVLYNRFANLLEHRRLRRKASR